MTQKNDNSKTVAAEVLRAFDGFLISPNITEYAGPSPLEKRERDAMMTEYFDLIDFGVPIHPVSTNIDWTKPAA